VRILAGLVMVLALVICLYNAQYLATQKTPVSVEADARNEDPLGRRRYVSLHGHIDVEEAIPYRFVDHNKSNVTVDIGYVAPIRPIAPTKTAKSMVFIDVHRRLYKEDDSLYKATQLEAWEELQQLAARKDQIYTGLMKSLPRRLIRATKRMKIPAVTEFYELLDGTRPMSPTVQLVPAACIAIWLVFAFALLPQYGRSRSDSDPREEMEPDWEAIFTKKYSIVSFIVLFLIGAALLAVGICIGMFNDPNRDTEALMIGLSLFMGTMGTLLMWVGIVTSSGEVVVAKKGVLVRNGFSGTLQVMPWADAEWMTHLAWYYKGVYNHRFTFGRRNGSKLDLAVVNQDGETVRGLATAALQESLLAEARRKLNNGETLELGDLKIDKSSIQAKGWFSWITIDPANLEMVTTTDGKICFTNRSGFGSGASVRYGKIRNVFIVPQLLAQVIRPLNQDAKLDW
jgi:hypothetical protein